MAGYILRRGLEVVPTVLLVLTLVFLALRILPGDPATPHSASTLRRKPSRHSARNWASISRSGCST